MGRLRLVLNGMGPQPVIRCPYPRQRVKREATHARGRVLRRPVQVDGRPGGARPQPLAPGHPARRVGAPGSEFRVECREWTDAQIGNNDSANDVRDVDLKRAHMLSGPIAVEGAEPGDLLVVDILDLGPCHRRRSATRPARAGATRGSSPSENGGGFLTDHYPESHKAIWDFHGQDATSRHIPGVRYTGITHPGLFGTAPSADLLAEWNRREQALIDTDPDRVPPLALPPLEDQTLAGTLSRRRAGEGRARGRADRAGARERRQPRHQELHARQPGLLPGARGRARTCPAATSTSPRATARSRSAARSRWAGSSTSAST